MLSIWGPGKKKKGVRGREREIEFFDESGTLDILAQRLGENAVIILGEL